jgi:hypothetical protein
VAGTCRGWSSVDRAEAGWQSSRPIASRWPRQRPPPRPRRITPYSDAHGHRSHPPRPDGQHPCAWFVGIGTPVDEPPTAFPLHRARATRGPGPRSGVPTGPRASTPLRVADRPAAAASPAPRTRPRCTSWLTGWYHRSSRGRIVWKLTGVFLVGGLLAYTPEARGGATRR